jgi:hypothetical protein
MDPGLVGIIGAISGMLSAIGATWFAGRYGSRTTIDSVRLQADLAYRQSIAGFRHQWIHLLRNNLAEFRAVAMLAERTSDEQFRLHETATRILLQLSPEDPNFARMKQLLDSYLEAEDLEARKTLSDGFIALSQSILSREWQRTKAALGDVEYTRSLLTRNAR